MPISRLCSLSRLMLRAPCFSSLVCLFLFRSRALSLSWRPNSHDSLFLALPYLVFLLYSFSLSSSTKKQQHAQLRPAPGREVTLVSLPTAATESFGNPSDTPLDPHSPHANGTLDTHAASAVIQPLDFSLDQGSLHDPGEFREFVHHDLNAKTHSTALDISHADQVTQPLDFSLDAHDAHHDAGRRMSFREAERDPVSHSTGFNVSHASEIIKPLDNSLDYGFEHADRAVQRTSQTFRTLQRGVKPPPVQKRKKQKKKKKKLAGFTGDAHKTGRGSVWKEMGRLTVEPYDQRLLNEQSKATRGMDLGDLVEATKKKANEKVNYNRMAELAKSNRKQHKESDSRESHNHAVSEKEQYRNMLNSRPAYHAKEMYWKPPQNFRAFDPSEYARDRNAKIQKAELQNWRPDQWNAVPDFCFKPTRDVGECD